MQETNGVVPDAEVRAHVARGEETRQRLADELRELWQDDEREVTRLNDLLTAARQRRDQTRGAWERLSGETFTQRKAAKPAASALVRPTPQSVEAVAAALTDGPMTQRQVEERAGVSHDVARRSLHALREDERVRLAGRAPRAEGQKGGKGASVFALMPNAEGGDDGD